MNTAIKLPTVKGKSIYDFTPEAVAGQYYKDGQGLDDNPYPKDSVQYEIYMLEMGRLQWIEYKRFLEEMRVNS
jgi:hypothetical protein